MFAVKFIHKQYTFGQGRLTPQQLDLEITLHYQLQQHANIVQFFSAGEDHTWKWIAMELAEGGDLFDKIESDVGVGEDIAHFYFTQLISAVSYMHSKGIGHRDIKPENILLSAEGNLKIADFGLATLFEYNGVRKLCTTSCGSPPYTAPEVLTCDSKLARKLGKGYFGDFVDIWSCAVVLFVLLVGNTPWDEPLDRSYEFYEFVKTNGRPEDELWSKLPTDTLSLLRGMMRIEPLERLSLADVRRHPWFTRKNHYLRPDGQLENPLKLATQMFENMKIDFSQNLENSWSSQPPSKDMGINHKEWKPQFASTQPETPTSDIVFDWERPPRVVSAAAVSASQPVTNDGIIRYERSEAWDDALAEEPSFSQFSSSPSVPLSRTQFARRFHDILPPHSLTRFFSNWPLAALESTISEALHRLGIPTSKVYGVSSDVPPAAAAAAATGQQDAPTKWIRIRATDSRNCILKGDVVIEAWVGSGPSILEVSLVKAKGDPVEWRRFFKKLVVLCKDAVYLPEV